MVTELILNSMVLVNIKHIDIHQLLKSIYVLNMSLDAFPSVQQSSVSVELSRVQLFMTPRTAAPQASMSVTNSRSLFKLMSDESMMSSSVVPFSCVQSSPASGSFQISQFFAFSGQSIGVSVLASVLPMNIQDDFL